MIRHAADHDRSGHPHPGQEHRHRAGERATKLVLALTVATMIAEIAAGWWTGSMALMADGWHMATHAAAMAVAVFAYRFMRRHARSGRYAAAHRAGDLGGFANAMLLAFVAVLVAAESAARLVSPGAIDFAVALWVAWVGLAVNLASAWLLRGGAHAHDHGARHGAGQGHGKADRHGHDHNREAAFVHVLADALTSALAIVALWGGRRYGAMWLDPLMGIVGAAVILRWSFALLRRTGGALLERHGH